MEKCEEVVLTLQDTVIPMVYESAGKPVDEVKGVPAKNIIADGTYCKVDGKWECVVAEDIPFQELGTRLFVCITNTITELRKEDPSVFLGEPVKLGLDQTVRNDLLVTKKDPVSGVDIYAHPVYKTSTNRDSGSYIPLKVYEP